MWSEEDVEKAKTTLFMALRSGADADGEVSTEVWSDAMRAALNAVCGWRPVDDNTPMQTPIQATAQSADGTHFETSVVYYEPYNDLGWLCARTHVPVLHTPTLWAPLLEPPADPNASDSRST